MEDAKELKEVQSKDLGPPAAGSYEALRAIATELVDAAIQGCRIGVCERVICRDMAISAAAGTAASWAEREFRPQGIFAPPSHKDAGQRSVGEPLLMGNSAPAGQGEGKLAGFASDKPTAGPPAINKEPAGSPLLTDPAVPALPSGARQDATSLSAEERLHEAERGCTHSPMNINVTSVDCCGDCAVAAIRAAEAARDARWREALEGWARCNSLSKDLRGDHCKHCAPLRALLGSGATAAPAAPSPSAVRATEGKEGSNPADAPAGEER